MYVNHAQTVVLASNVALVQIDCVIVFRRCVGSMARVLLGRILITLFILIAGSNADEIDDWFSQFVHHGFRIAMRGKDHIHVNRTVRVKGFEFEDIKIFNLESVKIPRHLKIHLEPVQKVAFDNCTGLARCMRMGTRFSFEKISATGRSRFHKHKVSGNFGLNCHELWSKHLRMKYCCHLCFINDLKVYSQYQRMCKPQVVSEHTVNQTFYLMSSGKE